MAVGLQDGHRVLGVDLETTGFDPRSDRIVQFALVGSDSGGSHVNTHALIDPGVPIPIESTRVHGIEDSDVRGSGGFGDHIDSISELIDGAVIVGHNVLAFDWRFMEVECSRIGRDVPEPLAIVDTLVIARRFGVPGRHKLGALCERYGIRLERSHSADADARPNLLILWKLMGAYPNRFAGSIEDFVESLSR